MSAQLIAAWVVFLVTQVGDIFSTAAILLKGGTEQNRLLRYLMDKFGMWPGLLVPKFGLVAFLHAAHADLYALLIISVLYLFVLWHNLRQLRR